MTKAKRDGYEWGTRHLDLAPAAYNEAAGKAAEDKYECPDKENDFFAGAVERRMSRLN